MDEDTIHAWRARLTNVLADPDGWKKRDPADTFAFLRDVAEYTENLVGALRIATLPARRQGDG